MTGTDTNGLYYYENVLTRLSADGSTLLYSTYFGDGEQMFNETTARNHKLALGGAGIAYITGEVNANGDEYPNSNGSFARGVSTFRAPVFAHGQEYVAKFDTTQSGNASLLYCTPIGVDNDPADGFVTALGVDSQKNLWIYGGTGYAGFPTLTANALQPTSLGASATTYLIELDPTGSTQLYGTFFGSSGFDDPYDMALDSNNNLYVVVLTESSTDYPLKNAAYTATNGNSFAMTRFAPLSGTGNAGTGLSVSYSTFLSERSTYSIAATAAGMVAVAGNGGVPLKNNVFPGGDVDGNATFQVFDTNASGDASVLSSSYLGEVPGLVYSVAFDSHQDLWIAGSTSAGLPVVSAYQSTCGDANCSDGFLARVQLLTLASSQITFPSTAVGASSAPMTATLSSQLLKSLSLAGSTLSDATDFTASNNCAAVLSPAGSCTFTFTFTPKSPGTLTSTFSITDAANPGEPLVVVLNGTATGVASSPKAKIAGANFGNVTVGDTTQPYQAVILTNTGTVPLTVGATSITGAGFSIANGLNQCTATLAPGSTCSVAVAFVPTAVGAVTGSLTIVTGAGTEVATLTGTGVAAAKQMASITNVVNFGNVDPSTPAVGYATLTNTGTIPLNVGKVSVSGPGFVISGLEQCQNSTLAVGQSCDFQASLTTTTTGAISGTLSVVTGAGTEVSKLTAYVVPEMASITSPLSFGNVPLNSDFATIKSGTLTNTGTIPLDVGAVSISGPGFALYGPLQCQNSIVAVGKSCTFQASFLPTVTGAASGTLTIVTGAGTEVATLTGTGVATANLNFAPASLNFSSTGVGSSSAAQTVTVMNSSSTALTITGVTLSGGQADDYVLAQGCVGSLAAGASCKISVSFKPVSAGTKRASVTIADNASGSPQSIALIGAGTASTAAPTASLSATSLTFAEQAAGTSSAAQTVTLTNTGSAALTLKSIAVTGAQADDYALSKTCGTSLASGAGCTLSVTFKPVSAGTKRASITIADNAAGSSQSIALTGTGTASTTAPTASLSATSLTFAQQAAGTSSAAQTVTLTNTGSAALTLKSIAVTGAQADDYALSKTCGTSLASGASCMLSVIFKPVSAGTKVASISITDNAGSSPQSVRLTGTGTAANASPSVKLSAAALTFAKQARGTSSAAQTVTVTNSGAASLTLTSITLIGGQADDYELANGCGASLAAKASCTLSIIFKPVSAGTKRASISIADNASGSPQVIALTGTGT